MKIKMDQNLRTVEGDLPMFTATQGEDNKEIRTPVTLQSLVLGALNYPEKDISGEEKTNRYALALRIRDAAEVDLTVEEVAMIKRLVDLNYPHPQIAGQVWAMLDPPAATEEQPS